MFSSRGSRCKMTFLHLWGGFSPDKRCRTPTQAVLSGSDACQHQLCPTKALSDPWAHTSHPCPAHSKSSAGNPWKYNTHRACAEANLVRQDSSPPSMGDSAPQHVPVQPVHPQCKGQWNGFQKTYHNFLPLQAALCSKSHLASQQHKRYSIKTTGRFSTCLMVQDNHPGRYTARGTKTPST